MSPMMPGMSPEEAEAAYAQQGAPPPPGAPGMMDPGAGAGAPPPGAGAPPETLDGPMGPELPVGISLNPAQMAAIALQAVAEISGIDLAQFQAGQQAAMQEVPGAIAAIMAELQMRAAAPETLDGPAAPMGPEQGAPVGGPPMNPEDEPGAMLA